MLPESRPRHRAEIPHHSLQNITRRRLFPTLLAAPLLAAKFKIEPSRISALTDEIGKTPAESLAFARQYKLSWVELRSIPGGGGDYAFLPEAEIRRTAGELTENALRVSFLNTGMLKFGLPGTEPARRRPETAEARKQRLAREGERFERRMEDLGRAIAAAHILGVDKVRVFTFSRIAEPESVFPRIAQILGDMAAVAAREKIHLLVENEGSCNVATCRELATLLEMVPSRWIGINWDALNGASRGEIPFPDGYKLLPKHRIGNVQIKGKSVMDTPDHLDWRAIIRTMSQQGYGGRFGLETHVFDGTLIQASHTSMREILRIVTELGDAGSRGASRGPLSLETSA